MKKIFLSAIVAAAAALPTFAAVDTLNYSAVVRDANGNAVANQEVSLLFQFVEEGNIIFDETVKVTTSSAGVVNYAIGSTKSLDGIDWTANDIKLSVSMDLNGGDNFTPVANSDVASVPTALYALKSADTENLYNDVDTLYGKSERTENQLNQIYADFANLGENLDNLVTEMTTHFDEVNAQLENLNMVSAVVRANEEQIEKNTADIATVKNDAYNAFEDIYQQLGSLEQVVKAVEGLEAWHLENDENILNLLPTFNAMNELLEENTEKIEELERSHSLLIATITPIEELSAQNADDIEALQGTTDRFASQITQLQNQVATSQADFENLGENLDNLVTEMNTHFEIIDGQLENLNNVSAVVRVNEEAIETLQADYKSLTENLDNSFARVGVMEEQVEQNVADIEALQGTTDRFGYSISTLQSNVATLQSDFENIGENLTLSFNEMDARFDTTNGRIENLEEGLEQHISSYERWKDQLMEGLYELQTKVDALVDKVGLEEE